MYSILFTLFVVSVSIWQTTLAGDQLDLSPQDQDLNNDFHKYLHQNDHGRQTRQAQSFSAQIPIAGNDKNSLSAFGGADFNVTHLQSATAGLALDNVKGHKLSLTEAYIPNSSNTITASGQANLFHNPNHDLSANAFIARNMPSNPQDAHFNTMGGGLDYLYKNRLGASVGVTHTPHQQQFDFSANGNLNLFRGSSSSLDFSAGVRKSMSPLISNSPWNPSASLTFKKWINPTKLDFKK